MNIKLGKNIGKISWYIIVMLAYCGLLNLVCKYIGHTEPQLSQMLIGAVLTVIVVETLIHLSKKHETAQLTIRLSELHKFIEGEKLTKYENFSLGYMIGHAGISEQEKEKIEKGIKE